MDRIGNGVIPRSVDERWFIYFEDNTLDLHLSWTGYCVFIVSLNEIENRAWHASHCLVSRDKEQYGETTDAEGIKLLHLVIKDSLV